MEQYGVAGARLTPYQKIVLIGVTPDQVEPLVDRPGRHRPAGSPVAAGGRTPWPAPASSSASSPSSRPRRGPATWSTELERRFPGLDVPITVNVNGCPNACARTQVADIGLKGQLVMHEGEQVGGFQVHLGGATGLQANFGRKLRAHKVTSEGLDDYVTVVVSNYLADRVADESFATWVARADEELLRGEKTLEGAPVMSERGFPVHCPYCGEQDLWPHDETPGSLGMPRLPARLLPEDARPREAGRIHARECTVMTAPPPGPPTSRAGIETEGRYPEELRELVSHWGAELELAPAENIIEWAAATFGDRFCITSSMGDAVLADLASKVVPGIDVVFLDTGYHFIETIGTRDAVAATLDVNLLTITPVQSVAEQDAAYGKDLYKTDPDLCCALRKVKPLTESLAEYDAWATGLRRAETHNRVIAPVIGWDAKKGKVKVSPLARWSDEQVERYIAENGVLVNPLVYDGYPSIGCAPCTRRVAPGEDARSGRWAGTNKTECGIHS